VVFIMQIETENNDKGKEVVPSMEKGKEVVPPLEVVPTTPEEVPGTDDDVVPEEPPSGKRRNYRHYHEEGVPTQFCKVTFKLLTPDTLKAIVFNDDGIEVATKCGMHDEAFSVNV
jgi:hypothetical protein